MQIAIDTGKRKIIEIIGPAMNFRNDVFEVPALWPLEVAYALTLLAYPSKILVSRDFTLGGNGRGFRHIKTVIA